ncbi:ribose-phosphate pyrophosphokinase 1 [Bachmanniomyces sp. S44760]|nr:ribose-phosphate pyrophosphokinase 1 [Bachmanniomyces sp. S44760]
MAERPADTTKELVDAQTNMADRTAAVNSGEVAPGELSKNAQKKAEKQAKLAAEKANKSATNTVKEAGRADAKKAVNKAPKKKIEGAALIGIDVAKEDDFSSWYQQVLTKGDMLDYYDVSGCYILKPASYFIWEEIQQWFNKRIKKLGVKNCSFPMFVSQDVLEREKDHIEGFAAEVAWVTHAGNTPLEKKIAIRPTSETVMYPYYAKWIRSHRDLPLRLNQWNSVVRWEFKHPQPFLRTREFLWQEGHTAHLTKEGAGVEVRQILEWYAGVYEELLAVPVIRGQKTEKEKFAGGLYTTTVEGYIPTTGRGIQGGTSHCLGQNFSKMFGITVEDPAAKEGEKKPPLHVWQNSWGLSTRVIGVMVMIHGDNRGLVLPPRVVECQVVIIPLGITAKTEEKTRDSLYAQVDALAEILRAVDVRVETDKRDGYSPGWKFNEWEQKGVPLRLEFGPGEFEGHFVTTSRRDIAGKEGKGTIPITEINTEIPALLETIQSDLYSRAEEKFKSHTKQITKWDDFVPALNDKNVCLIPHCLTEKCEDEIKELSARKDSSDETPEDAKAPSMGAKSLCIPFEQPEGIIKGKTKCTNPNCNNLAEQWCLFGRSY